jgi:glycosyltransferase involved in cell wall biosynthesis
VIKIVYCHNYYRYRGGEDISFECDLDMLRQEGHTVIPFTRENADLDDGRKLQMAANTIWNRSTYREMLELLNAEKPDVLQCNNLFPQISSSVYAAARKLKIPVVQALRNYRTFCANSLLFRDGQVCTKCLNSWASWQGLRYGCYRDSRLATSAVVAMQFFNRLFKVQKRMVDAFCTPTHFAREIHIRGGFSPKTVFVRNNFVSTDVGMNPQRGDVAVFIGRLSYEKGLATVIKAWQESQLNFPLVIVGDGPDAASLRQMASGNSNIHFTGQLDIAGVSQQLQRARFLLMSSLWYETFGRTVAEAFAQGIPVVASRLGAMLELVEDGRNGFLFQPGDSTDLARVMRHCLSMGESQLDQMRLAARATYQTRFSALASYSQLLDVYDYVVKNSKSRESISEARSAILSRGESMQLIKANSTIA